MSLDDLDVENFVPVRRALVNIPKISMAELTYAQIVHDMSTVRVNWSVRKIGLP